jgi:hypothetical protein
VLLACASVLAVEAVLLTFLTWLWSRPWYERLVALAPLGAFVWAVWLARQAHDAYDATQAFGVFMRAHYPLEFLWRGGELTAAAESVSRSGQIVLVMTIAALLLGVLLLLTPWREARRHTAPHQGTRRSSREPDAAELDIDITVQALHQPWEGHSHEGEDSDGS